MSAPSIWVLADPRAGTAAQALGIAERLGLPFQVKRLEFSRLAGLPNALLGASLLGLRAVHWRPPWPDLVIAAGRRSAPPALWLKQRSGAKLVHVMRPGISPEKFDLLVLPKHDRPKPAPNVLEIIGAPHRVTPEKLVAEYNDAQQYRSYAPFPTPRVALLVGGPVRGVGLDPDEARALARKVAAMAGTVLATTSRRTGPLATEAVSAGLAEVSRVFHRYGDPFNPYIRFLANADAVVVTGDSISMISEAAMTGVPLYIADLKNASGPRHRAFHQSLYGCGQARPFENSLEAFERKPLDETARIANAVRSMLGLEPLERGWVTEQLEPQVRALRLVEKHNAEQLLEAAKAGDHERVEHLLQIGNFRGFFGGEALLAASFKGDLRMVQILLRAGADKNYTEIDADQGFRSSDTMPLHAAILSDSLPVVKALVEAGADINGYYERWYLMGDDNFMGTALDLSVEFKKHEIEAYLRAKGALTYDQT